MSRVADSLILFLGLLLLFQVAWPSCPHCLLSRPSELDEHHHHHHHVRRCSNHVVRDAATGFVVSADGNQLPGQHSCCLCCLKHPLPETSVRPSSAVTVEEYSSFDRIWGDAPLSDSNGAVFDRSEGFPRGPTRERLCLRV